MGMTEGYPFEVTVVPRPIVKPRQNAGTAFLYALPGHALGESAIVVATTPAFSDRIKADWIRVATLKRAGVRGVVQTIESSRSAELRTYFAMCTKRDFIDTAVADLGLNLWRKLSARLRGRVQVPDACPGVDGEILLTWDQGAHHLELEITSDLSATFFYMNTKSNECWECAANANDPLDKRIWKALSIFKAPLSEIPESSPWGTSSSLRYPYHLGYAHEEHPAR
jgi:hypothetical protein